MTCILCNRSHDREGEDVCLLCAVLMAEADIAPVQDAKEAFEELDKEMEE